MHIGTIFATLENQGQESRAELDNHADTCVVGTNTALVIQDFGQPVRVHGYDETVSNVDNCKTVSAVMAYMHPETGEEFMLIIHQAILIPKMTVNLLSPMQLRANDICVNDEPKHMVLNPTEDHHAITVPSLEAEMEPFRIPLSLKGVTSYFPTRKPTRQEWENSDSSLHIELTSELPEWDPNTTIFEEQERQMLDSNGRIVEQFQNWSSKRIIASLHTLPQGEPPEGQLGQALEGNVCVRKSKTVTASQKRETCLKSLKTFNRGHAISPRTLAKHWGIGIARAKQTLDATTQKGVRTLLHPTLSRRFRTNDRQLRYRRLSHDMFTDTLKSRVVSWHRRNKYAQVFSTHFGWVRVYPMQKKSEAHEGLITAGSKGRSSTIVGDGWHQRTSDGNVPEEGETDGSSCEAD